MKNNIIKATKEGRLYIEVEDLLKSKEVRETISKLLDSDIVREIDKKEELVLRTDRSYISKDQEYFVINRSGNHGNIGLKGGELSEHISCHIEEDWREATEEESKKCIEKFLNLKYGEGWENMKVKKCIVYGDEAYINNGRYSVSIIKNPFGWEVWNKNGCLFNGKKWAEVLETNKVATDLSEIDRPYYIDAFGSAGKPNEFLTQTINHMTSKELCEGILALQQLIAFRDNFYEVHGGVYEDSRSHIKLDGGVFRIYITRHETSVFDFAEHEQAREFLETHRELFNELKKLY